MAVFVVGDVHGEADKLNTLVQEVRRNFEDISFYHVGDLIDRGPGVKEVLDICIRENIQGIMGNHELWFRDVLLGGSMYDGVYDRMMGGVATVQSYGLSRGDPDRVGPALRKAVPTAHVEYIKNLPNFRSITVGDQSYLLVHTGISAHVYATIAAAAKGEELDDVDVAHIYHEINPNMFFWQGNYPNVAVGIAQLRNHIQVFGHTPITKVVVEPHYIALDTGSGTCAPFKLSGVLLRADAPPQIYSVG